MFWKKQQPEIKPDFGYDFLLKMESERMERELERAERHNAELRKKDQDVLLEAREAWMTESAGKDISEFFFFYALNSERNKNYIKSAIEKKNQCCCKCRVKP